MLSMLSTQKMHAAFLLPCSKPLTLQAQKANLVNFSKALLFSPMFFLKIRQLLNDNGRPISEAVPSMPVQILGWRSLPDLGDHFRAVESEVGSS